MKAEQVKYTVKPEFVAQNKVNIQKVMDRLKAEPIDGMLYSSFTIGEGNTFVHINIARDQNALNELGEVEEFTAFRIALRASEPISPPQSTDLNLVAAGFEL